MSAPLHELIVGDIFPDFGADLETGMDIDIIHPPDCPDPNNERGACFVLEEMACVGHLEALGFDDPWRQELRGEVPTWPEAGRYEVGLYTSTTHYPYYEVEWHLTVDPMGSVASGT